MAAMEGDRHRPLRQELVEADQVPGLVGQTNGGIGSPGSGAASPAPFSAKPLHQPIDASAKSGRRCARRIGESAKLLVQRRVHVADALERVIEALHADIRCRHPVLRRMRRQPK